MEVSNTLRIEHPVNGNELSITPGETVNMVLRSSVYRNISFDKADFDLFVKSPAIKGFIKEAVKSDFKKSHVDYMIDYARHYLHIK